MSTTDTSKAKVVPPREAAEILNLGPTKITAMIRDKTLRSVKIGRARRVFVDSINELLSASEDVA
jgi:excisionase family DNA binding protein